MHALLDPSQMVSIFNSPSPSDEILGDGVEAVMGIFIIAARFPLIFEQWGKLADFVAYGVLARTRRELRDVGCFFEQRHRCELPQQKAH